MSFQTYMPVGTAQPLTTHDYIYLAVDLRNQDIIAELPVKGASYENKLSSIGEFSGSIPVNTDTLTTDLRTATAPGKTGLYVLRDGQPVWGGILWKRKYDSRGAKIDCSAKTFESYFYHRFQLTTKYWAPDTEQLDIARWLVENNNSAADLDIQVSSIDTGELRERTMFGYEFKTSGEELEALGNLLGGFDWNVNVYSDDVSGLKRSLEFYYPSRGVSRENSTLYFEYGGAIQSFFVDENAEESANILWAIGAGEGTEQVRAIATEAYQLGQGWPKLELSRSYKSVVRPSTLQGHADSDLERLKTPVTVFEVTVRADSDPVLGSYGVGDWARFRMEDAFITPALDTWARITGIKVSIDQSSGQEGVTLTLGGDEVRTESSSND